MLTDSCVMFFWPSRAVLSAIWRDEYLTSAVRTSLVLTGEVRTKGFNGLYQAQFLARLNEFFFLRTSFKFSTVFLITVGNCWSCFKRSKYKQKTALYYSDFYPSLKRSPRIFGSLFSG